MTLEEIVQQLRDAQTVTAAQTLRHEQRLKDHQQWLEDNELAYARHREAMERHERMMERHDWMMEQHDRMMADGEVRLQRLEAKIEAFIDSLRKGGNGHNS